MSYEYPSSSNNLKCFLNVISDSLHPEYLEKIISCSYKRGQTIFTQGHQPRGLYCLYSGKIKIVLISSDGKESISRLVLPGDIFGARTLFSNENYVSSAVALEDSTVNYFEKELIFNLITKYPELAVYFLKILSKGMGNAEAQSQLLVHCNVRERLACLLLKLKESVGVAEGDRIVLDVRLTREEMATMIGTTHESLARLVTEFKNEKIIIQEGKSIIIINLEKLKEFANVR